MRTTAILVAVSVVCSISTTEAHAQSGYTLSVSSPTNGSFYTNGSMAAVGNNLNRTPL
jgi:hypothetical protein